MISDNTVISQCVPPSQTRCPLVYGRVEGSQGQAIPDTPWSSGLAFPQPPVLEVIRSSNQTLIEEDQRRICPAWDGVYEDMMEWKQGGSGQEGAHWGVWHKPLKRTRFRNHIISLLISDISSKSMQISDFVKADFCCDYVGCFCDFSEQHMRFLLSQVASFPGLPRLQFLLACSMQKRSKRSKTGAGEGLGTRLESGPSVHIHLH